MRSWRNSCGSDLNDRRDPPEVVQTWFGEHVNSPCGPLTSAYASSMFMVTETDAAAIRAIYDQEGELSAAIELRRRFRGITDNAKARECVRMIAGWKPPLPLNPATVVRLRAARRHGALTDL
jgi:hypothetical protein